MSKVIYSKPPVDSVKALEGEKVDCSDSFMAINNWDIETIIRSVCV